MMMNSNIVKNFVPIYKPHNDIKKIKLRYGLAILIKYSGYFLLFVFTLILCATLFPKLDVNFDKKIKIEDKGVTVTVTPAYISFKTTTPENSNWHLVTSNSSIQIDTTVTGVTGQLVFIYENLPPNDSYWFESNQPCIISGSAG
jgi:hypothetical protein